MRLLLLLGLALLLGCEARQPAHHDGEVHDPSRQRTIPYRFWLAAADQPRPLILVSHGSGGDHANQQWLIDTLVAHGFHVAAPRHPGNTAGDNSPDGVFRVWERPQDVSRLLDALLADPRLAPHIDAAQIGVAGFSSGGYTALALAGARYDADLMKQYCESHERGRDCDLIRGTSFDTSGAGRPYGDVRIRAALALAPAVGMGIDPASLVAVTVPVLVVAAQDDEVVAAARNARRYAAGIPGAQLELLPQGGHFIFLECTLPTRVADLFITELRLCPWGEEEQRASTRAAVAARAVDFFVQTLTTASPATQGDHP